MRSRLDGVLSHVASKASPTFARVFSQNHPEDWRNVQEGDPQSPAGQFPSVVFDPPAWQILVVDGALSSQDLARLCDLFPEAKIQAFKLP